MKVNIWGMNYWPEPVGIGLYTGEMGEYLANNGHEVSVVTTFPYYPKWEKRLADERVIFRTDQADRVAIHRCWHYVPKKQSFLKRLLYEFSFILISTYRQLRLPKPDLYIVIGPPLLLGLAAVIVSWLKGAPFIVHCQDLQLDAAVGLGVLQFKPLERVLAGIERLIYRRAARVSAITAAMCECLLGKGIAESKLVLFPNWVEVPEPDSLPERGLWKKKRGLASETQVISYSGVLAFRQEMHRVIEAAKLLAGSTTAVFVIAGNGPERRRLEEESSRLKLKNLLFEDILANDEHTALLIDSEICLIPQRRGTGPSSFPSKLLKTVALGRPVLTNADIDSSLYECVSQGGFGLAVESNDSLALVSALKALLSDVELREQMGERGLKFARRFNKAMVLREFVEVMGDVVKDRTAERSKDERVECPT